MKLFKKKMNIIRFRAMETSEPDTVSGICSSLAENHFDEINNISFEEISGFTTLKDPYDGDNFAENEIVQDGVLSAVFRRDTKSVPSAVVEREYLKKYGFKKIARNDIKSFKEDIKMSLLGKIPFKTACTPFVYNIKGKYGYFLSNSKSAYAAFEEAFSRVLGVNIISTGFCEDESPEFLSWLWWKVDTNHYFLPQDKYAEVVGKVTVKSESGVSISGNGSHDEMKLALADDCNATFLTLFVDGLADVGVSLEGVVSGLVVPPENMPTISSPSCVSLIAYLDEVFTLFDDCKKMYLENGEKEYAQGKDIWIKPRICEQTFEDI